MCGWRVGAGAPPSRREGVVSASGVRADGAHGGGEREPSGGGGEAAGAGSQPCRQEQGEEIRR